MPSTAPDGGSKDESAELLRFLYACPMGLLEIAADGHISLMNPLAMQLLLPLAPGHLVTNLFLVMEKWAPELRNLVASYPHRQGKICEGHRIVVRPGNRENDFYAEVLACTLVKLAEDRFAVTVADVSAEVARERRLKQAEVWFASLLDDINDFAVLSMDAEGRVEHINSSTTRQTGFTREDLVGHAADCLDVAEPGSTAITIREQLACAARDGWHLSEGWQHKRNGTAYWCQRLVAVRTDPGHDDDRAVSGYLMVLRDVTPRHADAGQLVDLLRKDHLTGASNRAHFFAVAEREVTRARQTGKPLSLVAVDIDHFKHVNDTYGHPIGDQVLKSFTEIARSALRPIDTLARLCGEEFCILLPDAALADAIQVSERIREHLFACMAELHDFSVTASFGCAQLPEAVTDPADLLTAADQALYTAKRAGRNRTEPSLLVSLEPACLT